MPEAAAARVPDLLVQVGTCRSGHPKNAPVSRCAANVAYNGRGQCRISTGSIAHGVKPKICE